MTSLWHESGGYPKSEQNLQRLQPTDPSSFSSGDVRRIPDQASRFGGTFPPSRRASERPIAIACLRLLTFLPDLPDFNLPCFISRIARPTFCEALLPYFFPLDFVGIAIPSLRFGLTRGSTRGCGPWIKSDLGQSVALAAVAPPVTTPSIHVLVGDEPGLPLHWPFGNLNLSAIIVARDDDDRSLIVDLFG